jgi:hypothetical protein
MLIATGWAVHSLTFVQDPHRFAGCAGLWTFVQTN